MKRSRMVKILAESIIKHLSTTDNITVTASCSLRDLEEAGMLPPNNTGGGVCIYELGF